MASSPSWQPGSFNTGQSTDQNAGNANQPTTPLLQNIPYPTPDLPSLWRTTNALRDTVQKMAGQTNTGNNKSPGNSGNQRNPAKKNTQAPQWTEVQRVTEQVRIYNPNDHEQYVDILQINLLEMRDNLTGATWIWTR